MADVNLFGSRVAMRVFNAMLSESPGVGARAESTARVGCPEAPGDIQPGMHCSIPPQRYASTICHDAHGPHAGRHSFWTSTHRAEANATIRRCIVVSALRDSEWRSG